MTVASPEGSDSRSPIEMCMYWAPEELVAASGVRLSVPLLYRPEFPEGVVQIDYWKPTDRMGKLGVTIEGEYDQTPERITVQRVDANAPMQMEYWVMHDESELVLTEPLPLVGFARGSDGLWRPDEQVHVVSQSGFNKFASLIVSEAYDKQREQRLRRIAARHQAQIR